MNTRLLSLSSVYCGGTSKCQPTKCLAQKQLYENACLAYGYIYGLNLMLGGALHYDVPVELASQLARLADSLAPLFNLA